VFSIHEVTELWLGWQHASQSEQNARAPQSTCEQLVSNAQNAQPEGERDHVGRPSRHFAGLPLSTRKGSRNAKRISSDAWFID
jgi:hypothetical protein